MWIEDDFGHKQGPAWFQLAMDFLQRGFLIRNFAKDSYQQSPVGIRLWQLPFSPAGAKEIHIPQTSRLHLFAERIDHLFLAMAIATLCCHELGEFVLKQGEPARCLVDPAHKRTLSLFQLGLRWLKRILATGLHFLPVHQNSNV